MATVQACIMYVKPCLIECKWGTLAGRAKLDRAQGPSMKAPSTSCAGCIHIQAYPSSTAITLQSRQVQASALTNSDGSSPAREGPADEATGGRHQTTISS